MLSLTVILDILAAKVRKNILLLQTIRRLSSVFNISSPSARPKKARRKDDGEPQGLLDIPQTTHTPRNLCALDGKGEIP